MPMMNVIALCILIALVVSISAPVPLQVPCPLVIKLHAKLNCSGKSPDLLINSDTQYLLEDQFAFLLLENRDPYWIFNPAFNPLLIDFQKDRPPRVLS